jgi:hypothetical protein
MKQINFKCQIFVLTIILTTTFSINTNSQNSNNNDLSRYGLMGKVKSLRTVKYEVLGTYKAIKKGKALADKYTDGSNSLVRFDKQGYIVSGERYNSDGSLYLEYNYKYNKQYGHTDIIYKLSDGSITGKDKRKYDDNGNLIEVNHSCDSTGNNCYKYIYKYDEKGRMIEHIQYNSFALLDTKYTYKYDDKDNLIEENYFTYNSKGVTNHIKETYKYDNKGNEIEKIILHVDVNISKKLLSKYDKNNKVIEENWYNSEGPDSKSFYKYSNNYKKLKLKCFSEEDILTKMTIEKYDDKGNIIECKEYNSEKELGWHQEIRYVYDNKGNWIKKTEYRNKTPYSIIQREINYYK